MQDKEKLTKLFEAQDIIRLLWAMELDRGLEIDLRQLNKDITDIINKIGKQ